MVDVCLLGSGGVMPLRDRWLSSLLIRYNGRIILIDCGEGTQIPIKMAEWGFKAIDIILITHYHADHIAGLPGLLLTIGNSGRKEDLTIMGPPGLVSVLEGILVICPILPFKLKLIELPLTNLTELYFSNFYIRSLPVEHTLPCLSYCFEVKRRGKFNANQAKKLDIPIKYWKRLQLGESVVLSDVVIYPEEVLGEERKGIKVSYCTDSRPTTDLIEFIKGSDLFVCEGMYGDEDDSDKAVQKKHMMFSEAALLSKQGEVKQLWLTHYSPSLTEPDEFVDNIKFIFANVIAGKDMLKYSIKF